MSDIIPYETRERLKVGSGKDSKNEDANESVKSDKHMKDLDKYMEDEEGNLLPIYVGPLPCDPNPDDYYLD